MRRDLPDAKRRPGPVVKALGCAGLAALALAAAGCGGDDDATSPPTDTTTTAPAPPPKGAAGKDAATSSLDVSETDFKLGPSNPTVKKGIIQFNVTNNGQVPHSLEVEGPGEESQLPKTLQPGSSATLNVDLSQPGRYEWYCPIGNHKDLGMAGEITVK